MMSKMKEELTDLVSSSTVRKGYTVLGSLNDNSDQFNDRQEEEDCLFALHQKNNHHTLVHQIEMKNPHPCLPCCAVLSLFGVIFLVIVGSIVANNSIYIPVKPAEGKKKSSLAGSIFLAAFLYLVTFVLSVFYYLRALRKQQVLLLSAGIHENDN